MFHSANPIGGKYSGFGAAQVAGWGSVRLSLAVAGHGMLCDAAGWGRLHAMRPLPDAGWGLRPPGHYPATCLGSSLPLTSPVTHPRSEDIAPWMGKAPGFPPYWSHPGFKSSFFTTTPTPAGKFPAALRKWPLSALMQGPTLWGTEVGAQKYPPECARLSL